jgi:hypothetical protein
MEVPTRSDLNITYLYTGISRLLVDLYHPYNTFIRIREQSWLMRLDSALPILLDDARGK